MITRLLGRLWKLPSPAFAVDHVQNIPVPMRDGANLLTDIYHPRAVQNPPTVLMRSPYGRGSLLAPMGRLFAEQGYTTLIQSVRGTFGSDGHFDPFFQERDDGVDTVAWVERQLWYHGKLGLFGPSYLGFVQWAIAAELGDRIAAMATSISTSDFHASIYEGGGFRLEDYVRWISMLATQGRTSSLVQVLRERIFGDPHKDRYIELPIKALDQSVTGKEIAHWRTWVDHDDLVDPFWTPIKNIHNMEDVRAPVSMVGGWSDFFFPLQVRDFKAMKNLGKTVRLKVGPWTHSNFQGIGEAIRDALDWFDIHLRGHARPLEDLGRVLFWVNGANEWRHLREWPRHTATLSLDASGRLTADGAEAGDFTFTYDPSRPTPSLEGAKLSSRTGRGDMGELTARSDVLVFDGPSVDVQRELLGNVSVTLTTSATTPHHDLFVCLCDVSPLGKAINITDGYRRLSLASGGVGRRTTTIEALPAAWRLDIGHRLRLLVAAGAFPRFARNLGLGEPLATATKSRQVDITVHCGAGVSFISI
jgi:putative CocE/NonD family hydrolase